MKGNDLNLKEISDSNKSISTFLSLKSLQLVINSNTNNVELCSKDNLLCNLCFHKWDDKDFYPFKFTSCNHLICFTCLEFINSFGKIICPLDDIPQNCSPIKMDNLLDFSNTVDKFISKINTIRKNKENILVNSCSHQLRKSKSLGECIKCLNELGCRKCEICKKFICLSCDNYSFSNKCFCKHKLIKNLQIKRCLKCGNSSSGFSCPLKTCNYKLCLECTKELQLNFDSPAKTIYTVRESDRDDFEYVEYLIQNKLDELIKFNTNKKLNT